jgi:hypothetical protein
VGEDDDPRPDDVEFLDVGAKRGVVDVLRVRRRPGWLPLLLAGLAASAVIAIVVVSSSPSGSPQAHTPPTSVSSFSAPTTPQFPGGSVVATGPVVVTRLGRPLLGAHEDYDLFARGTGVVVRIEMARGRVTRTTVPELASSGPVTFVAGADWSLIRPIDRVPGYLIPDGQPAREPPRALDRDGPAYPGPDPNTVWIPATADRSRRMVLVGIDGRRSTRVSLPIPVGSSPLAAIPDQVGFLLFPARGGVYDVSLAGTRRITAGTVVAVGPTRWLASECDRRAHCAAVVIDRSDGARRPLDIRLDAADAPAGVISPDGTRAALPVRSPGPAIEVVDLTTGAEHALSLRVSPNADWETLVWSPDSRWLFTTDADGTLYTVDARTGQIIDLSPAIGPAAKLSQLFIRNGR